MLKLLVYGENSGDGLQHVSSQCGEQDAGQEGGHIRGGER